MEDFYQFDNKFNFSDVFLRDLSLGVYKTLDKQFKYNNIWYDQTRNIKVPFYYSMTGDEQFLLDAFLDDVIGDRPNLNTDPIPRAHFTLASYKPNYTEMTNPNVYMTAEKIVDGKISTIKAKFRPLPIKASFDVEIILINEIDLMKLWESIYSNFQQTAYTYFTCEVKGFRLDYHLSIPESQNIELNRNIADNKGETKKKLKFTIDVSGAYPIEPKNQKLLTPRDRALFKASMYEMGFKPKKPPKIGEYGF